MIEGPTYVGIPPYSEQKGLWTSGGTKDVIVSLIEVNVEVSLSSFVKISAMLCKPAMCLMQTVLSKTDSRMAFSRMVMCRRPFVVVDFDQQTQALLSLKICIGDCVSRKMEAVAESVMRCCRRRMAFTHSSVAYISASAELRAVTC